MAVVGLQVMENQVQPEKAPRRWVFRPARLPAVAAAWLPELRVGAACGEGTGLP